MLSKGEILEDITIESATSEGNAVAHVEGIALFVPQGVPGDVVDVRVLKKKKNYILGKIEKIKKPSTARQEAFCEHFGICGGCKWQILPYEMQLQAKQQQVYDQLVRIGHLDIPEISPIIGSDKTRYYRNKLEFTFSKKRWLLAGENPEALDESELMGLGFHVSSFFDKVLDIKCCHLQAEPSNAIRLFIKEYALRNRLSFYDIRNNAGLLRTMFIRNTEDGQIMLIVCFGEDSPSIIPLLEAVKERFKEITSIYYVINRKKNDAIADQHCIHFSGADAIFEKMENLVFRIGPKSFYQTNSPQACKLYSVARDFARLSGKETVYDLYTGTGTIAQFISSAAARVTGIEYVEEAIEDARENARRNGISNCEFIAGDMKDVLTDEFIASHAHPDVIILDPPRAGIHPDVAQVILNAAPQTIVYVSCNPASQARDLAVLCRDYKITAVQPVDMFPHTQHVENVCQLVRK